MMTALPARWRAIYPGWWLAVGACFSLGMVAGMTFWAFGLYARPLHAEFGWSEATIAAAASLTLLISGCTSPLVGRLVERWQPRRVIAIGSVGTAVVYIVLAHIATLWQFLLLMVVLAFFRTWIFYIPFTTLVTHWFTRRRSTAMGIATAGFGMGGLVFSPLLTAMTQLAGWRASFLFSALLVVVINGAFVVLVRNAPSGRWTDYDSHDSSTATIVARGLFQFSSVRNVLRAPIFWCMAASFSLFFTAQWAFLYHGPLFFEGQGYSANAAATIFSISAGIGVVLRFVSGRIIDRIQRIEVLGAIVLTAMALALGLLFLPANLMVVGSFAILWGIGSGLGPALEPLLVSRMFGRARYASIYGIMDGLDTVIAIPGPWLGGLVFEASHSYAPVLAIYATLFAIGSGSFLVLTWRTTRLQQRATSVQRDAADVSTTTTMQEKKSA